MGQISNELIYATLIDIKGTLGEVKGKVEENKDHTIAVSAKADAVRKELMIHAEKDEAHYKDFEAHGRGNTLKFLVSIAGVVLGAEAVFHLGKLFFR